MYNFRADELEANPEKGYWIAQAIKIRGAENKAQIIAQEIAETRRNNG